MNLAPDLAALPGNTHVATTPKAPRFDMYVLIHKALRQFMSHTLQRVGAMDIGDTEERTAVLDGVDALLHFMRDHLKNENDFVHTAIEARRPGGARHTADDHLLHSDAIGNLEDESRALRNARDEHRPALALRLYRHLADFIGENLQHMQIEETQNNALLWALYSDEELFAIHDRILASLPPEEHALVARWMAASLNIQELILVYGGMQQKAPPPVVDTLLGIVRTQLSEARWAQLARALGRAPVPGLMTA